MTVSSSEIGEFHASSPCKEKKFKNEKQNKKKHEKIPSNSACHNEAETLPNTPCGTPYNNTARPDILPIPTQLIPFLFCFNYYYYFLRFFSP
jgi:hypothetical protein